MDMTKYVFDREKLETLIEQRKYDVQPTEQFVVDEMERCKDPRYFFNNYWTVNGKQPDPKSVEEWEEYEDWQNKLRYGKPVFIKRRTFL